MHHIIFMTFLGVLSGMISCFWTRIIRKNMIFRKFGKHIEILNNRHLIEHTCDSLLIKFIRCCFCIQVWITLGFCLFYIIDFHPYWIYALIGTLGALGAGNLVCEFVYALRNEVE